MSNSGLTIRHKLYDEEWWKDKEFIAELDHRYQSLENGTDKGYTLDKLQTSINKLRKKSRT